MEMRTMRSPYAATYLFEFGPRGCGWLAPGIPGQSGIITRSAGVCKGGGQDFVPR
jgi:hypothetical protein